MAQSRKEDPLVVIPYLLDKNDQRQRTFARDRNRSRRKFNLRIQETANAAVAAAAGLEDVAKNQDERKKLFTAGMIGAPPAAWALRTTPEKADLPKLPREPYYTSPGARPARRFSDPDLFDETGLSPVGRARLRHHDPHQPGGLPPGWTEHYIGDTFSDVDAWANVDNAIALDEKNAMIVDKGRVYFYNEDTGEVSWAPPKGSSMLATESFLHFGRVAVHPPPREVVE